MNIPPFDIIKERATLTIHSNMLRFATITFYSIVFLELLQEISPVDIDSGLSGKYYVFIF